MSIEIIPHYGFGKVKFGLNQKECEAILGAPSDSYTEKIDGTEEVVTDYENLGLDLSFSEADNYRLGTISVYAEDTILLDQEFIGLTEEELLELAPKAGIDDLELEDDFDDISSKDYYSDKYSLSFWVIEGEVDSITVFPAVDPEDLGSPKWPI